MKKLIVANWKENPETEQEALKLFAATAKIPCSGFGRGGSRGGAEIVVCPPFVYLEPLVAEFHALRGTAKKNLTLGGQDIFWERTGAFTGEIGPTMLKSLGAKYAIIGHSERRRVLHETDEMVNKKVAAALAAGLKVILCVGESREVRRQGSVAAMKFVKEQLAKDLSLKVRSWKKNLVIAYEPIWAIGTGKNCAPGDAVLMAQFIKKALASIISGLKSPILYGGSVNGKNAAGYLRAPEISGALVGGASLDAKEFAKIIKSAS